MLLIFVIGFLFDCFNQTSTYYYYKGEKVNVAIDEEHYYVVLSDTLDWTSTNLSRQYAFSSTQSGVQSAGNQKEYWKIIQVRKLDAKTNGKIRASDLLDTNPKMKYVGPVLKYDYPLAVSELFYIKLRSNDDFAYLQSMAEDTHCEIIGEVSYMPLWYTLKVPAGKDALSMTNTFYETGHFEDVDPGFIFNFQTECTNDPLFANQWGLRNSNGPDIKACDAWNLTRGNGWSSFAGVAVSRGELCLWKGTLVSPQEIAFIQRLTPRLAFFLDLLRKKCRPVWPARGIL